MVSEYSPVDVDARLSGRKVSRRVYAFPGRVVNWPKNFIACFVSSADGLPYMAEESLLYKYDVHAVKI